MHYLVIALLFIAGSLQATAISSDADGGLWSDVNTWTGGAVPTVGDTVTIIQGSTVTVDAFFNIGTGIANNVALQINGTLDVPYYLGTGTITCRGRVILAANTGAQWKIARSTNPYSANTQLYWVIDSPSADNAYIQISQGVGASVCAWYGQISSQTATSAYSSSIANTVTSSTNVVTLDTDLGLQVGQQCLITPTEATAQTDVLTVTGYNAPTKQVTFGSNFTYTHSTGAYLLNTSRNVIFKSSTTANGAYFNKAGYVYATSRNTPFVASNIRFEDFGGASSSYGFYEAGMLSTYTNCVFFRNYYNYFASGGLMNATDCIFYWARVATYNVYCSQEAGAIFTRCWSVGNMAASGGRYGFYDVNGGGNTYDTCYVFGVPNGYGFRGPNHKVINARFQAISYGVFYAPGLIGAEIDISSGTYVKSSPTQTPGTNAPYFDFISDGYTEYSVIARNYKPYKLTPYYNTSASYIYDTLLSRNSQYRVQSFNQVGTDHFVFTAYGMVMADSTNVRTTGKPSLRFDGNAATNKGFYPITITMDAPANTANTVLLRGYTKTNPEYTANFPSVRLYSDDGSIDVTDTHSGVANAWEFMTGAGTILTTTTVHVAFTAQLPGAATAYFADYRLYVGNNVYSLGEDWLNGYPQASPVASTIDATNVWGASTMTFTTAGTFGGVVGTNLDAKVSSAGGTSLSTTTIAESVWNSPTTSYQASGTMGELMKKMWAKIKTIFATQ